MSPTEGPQTRGDSKNVHTNAVVQTIILEPSLTEEFKRQIRNELQKENRLKPNIIFQKGTTARAKHSCMTVTAKPIKFL